MPRLRVAASVSALLAVVATRASAHEKWFYPTTGFGLRWDLLLRPIPAAFVGVVLLATIAAALVWRKRGRGIIPAAGSFGGLAVLLVCLPLDRALWLRGLRSGPMAILVPAAH